jgi:hypothetical protein
MTLHANYGEIMEDLWRIYGKVMEIFILLKKSEAGQKGVFYESCGMV